MNNICMCKEHTDMIKNIRFPDLLELSNNQSSIMMQLDILIGSLDDLLYDFSEVLTESKGTSLNEIIKNFMGVRDNAKNIFDVAQEEIKKRLDESPSHRLFQGNSDISINDEVKE